MNRAERRRQRALDRRGVDHDAWERGDVVLTLTPKGEAFALGLPMLPDDMPQSDDDVAE